MKITCYLFFSMLLALSSMAWAQVQKNQSVYQLESSWTDQNGKKINLKEFRGKPLILAMVYTSCQAACPLIVSDLQKIAAVLPQPIREKTQFALFSFDPGRDTAAQLKKFAAAHDLDQKSWTLLTSSSGAVRELAAVLGMKYRKDPNGDFSHSNVITILDADGVIRHRQEGLSQDPRTSAQVVVGLFATPGN